MKKRNYLFPLCLALLLSGCASAPRTAADGSQWQEDWIPVGTQIGIEAPKHLTLLDNKETLAADGLYYAAWTAGDSVPYENSDGDTIDLYDAQLYFLSSETMTEEKAKENCEAWLSAARENYEIRTEDTVTLGGQTYTWITYDCASEDNPYDRGVSAFGVSGTTAVCAEFACLEDYTEDLETILTDFLNGCHFKAE